MQEEAILIAKAQAGDREAVNALVALHWQPLYRYLAYKVGDREEAKELSQETWLRLVRALPQYRQNGASFKSFLYRIAGNLVVDHWRKNGRKPAVIELEECERQLAVEEGPEAWTLRQERQAVLQEVMGELPLEQRQTLEWRLLAGFSVKDTAAALGKSEGAVKMLQLRALEQVRKRLAVRGFLEIEGVRK